MILSGARHQIVSVDDLSMRRSSSSISLSRATLLPRSFLFRSYFRITFGEIKKSGSVFTRPHVIAVHRNRGVFITPGNLHRVGIHGSACRENGSPCERDDVIHITIIIYRSIKLSSVVSEILSGIPELFAACVVERWF